MAGSWQMREVWDGTYTFDDLIDWYELQAIKAENQRRYEDYFKSKNDISI